MINIMDNVCGSVWYKSVSRHIKFSTDKYKNTLQTPNWTALTNGMKEAE